MRTRSEFCPIFVHYKMAGILSVRLKFEKKKFSNFSLTNFSNFQLEDLMTPPEKTLLENVNSVFEKLSLAEEQLDDTLFILQLFQHFQRDAIKNES